MNRESNEYSFEAVIWKSEGPGGWFFASIPNQLSIEIRSFHQESEEGWGRLKAVAKIEDMEWETAIWFDTKHDCYLLPVKANIRKKLGIHEGSNVTVKLELEL